MAKKLKLLLLILILLFGLAGFFNYRIRIKELWLNLSKKTLPQAVNYQKPANYAVDPNHDISPEVKFKFGNEKNSPSLAKLPTEFKPTANLAVPFTSQAPNADWNPVFKEACEEAVAMMVDRFYRRQTFNSPNETENKIIQLVDWQNNYFGGHFDLTLDQTAEMIKKYFKYSDVEIIDNPTIEDIKQLITNQWPVIVPAAGQDLNNPHFKTPGPIYHMLLIKGYTKDKFITNDPGTKFGADYLYDYKTVMEAMHDWNNGADIRQGAKRVMVVYPN